MHEFSRLAPNATAILAFIGLFAGVWKLAIVAVAIGLFAWRSGFGRSHMMRWLLPIARTTQSRFANPPGGHSGSRTDWIKLFSWKRILLVLVLTLLGAIVLTRWISTPRERGTNALPSPTTNRLDNSSEKPPHTGENP